MCRSNGIQQKDNHSVHFRMPHTCLCACTYVYAHLYYVRRKRGEDILRAQALDFACARFTQTSHIARMYTRVHVQIRISLHQDSPPRLPTKTPHRPTPTPSLLDPRHPHPPTWMTSYLNGPLAVLSQINRWISSLISLSQIDSLEFRSRYSGQHGYPDQYFLKVWEKRLNNF